MVLTKIGCDMCCNACGNMMKFCEVCFSDTITTYHELYSVSEIKQKQNSMGFVHIIIIDLPKEIHMNRMACFPTFAGSKNQSSQFMDE